MKLKNKKTGEIVDAHEIDLIDNYVYLKIFRAGDYDTKQYNSLAELNEEWEDYKEPKPQVAYYIDRDGKVVSYKPSDSCPKRVFDKELNNSIGNYFETRKEAEKAVEKLKAWKRLKEKGFRFNNCKIEMSEIVVPEITITAFIDTEEPETLNLVNLLFGGE